MARKLTRTEAHTVKLECLKMAVMCLQPVQAKNAGEKGDSVLIAAEGFYDWVSDTEEQEHD